MAFRAFTVALLSVATLAPVRDVAAAGVALPDAVPASAGSDGGTPPPTFNDFYPEQRALSDCLSSLPKPDCGSEARGGWPQTAVFAAILAGLSFIAWRVVAASRRARLSRTPAATTARGGGDGAPTP